MSEPKKITYRIPKKGSVENREIVIETEGFVGQECMATTELLKQTLSNNQGKTTLKDEFYKEDDGTSVLLSED